MCVSLAQTEAISVKRGLVLAIPALPEEWTDMPQDRRSVRGEGGVGGGGTAQSRQT